MVELRRLLAAGLLIAAATIPLAARPEGEPAEASNTVKVSAEPMHAGRISPMIYGGFIEILKDLVPGMWAEMLNDRGFEGVTSPTGFYEASRATICDREWDENPTWTYDAENAFNGSRSVKLTASAGTPAFLSQAGQATKKGMTYHFSGYFRTDGRDAKVTAALKALLPDGTWMMLASGELPVKGTEWQKYVCQMVSAGTTDRAVFEIEVNGTGSLWADGLSLMPADNVKGWRKDVVDAIREQKPGVIRWGGGTVDPVGYKWKNGIGDRDRRAPFLITTRGRRMDSNDVGMDEFLQFCELVGAEPLVCVSVSDGAESAGDLVRYVNASADTEWGRKRAENGHPEPYHVKYWQIGNEMSGEEYNASCVAFCKAIREAQPDALILSSFPRDELLAKVGQEINYTCPHLYCDNIDADEQYLRGVAEMIERAHLEGKVKVGITEWNTTGCDWGILRGRLQALGCGLFAGRYLNFLQRHSDLVDIACRSNMTNSFSSGMIQTNAAALYKTPGYHVMKLYAVHSKPIPLVVTGAPDDVDMSACASDDGKAVTVYAVNMRKEPVEIRLDLSERGETFGPVSGEVVCDTKDKRQIEVMNHFDAPDRVTTVTLDVSGETITLPAFSAAAIECAAR